MENKYIGLRVKELKRGGFLSNGYALLNVYLVENGKEIDLGDYFMNPSNEYKVEKKLDSIKEKFESKGYDPVGDW